MSLNCFIQCCLCQCQSFLANLFNYFLRSILLLCPVSRRVTEKERKIQYRKTKRKQTLKTCFPVTFIFNQVASLYAKQTAQTETAGTVERERWKTNTIRKLTLTPMWMVRPHTLSHTHTAAQLTPQLGLNPLVHVPFLPLPCPTSASFV